jgi:hypothetical protein
MWRHHNLTQNAATEMLSDITPIIVRAGSVSSRANLARSFNKLYYLLANRRVFDRVPVDHEVMITWRDRNGEGLTKGVCQDISPAGIGIRSPEPIPVRTTVRLRIGQDIAVVPAVVLRQMQDKSTFVIGMEFTNKAEHYQPRNERELDLATDGMTW